MKTKVQLIGVMAEAMSESDLRSAKDKSKKSRMYFVQEGPTPEGAVINPRPKVLFRDLFNDIFAQIGETPTKVNFDKLAGCHKEATAPGFVLDGIFNRNIKVTYAVTVEEEPKVEEQPKVEVAPKAEVAKVAKKRSHKAKAKIVVVPATEEATSEQPSEEPKVEETKAAE